MCGLFKGPIVGEDGCGVVLAFPDSSCRYSWVCYGVDKTSVVGRTGCGMGLTRLPSWIRLVVVWASPNFRSVDACVLVRELC